MRTIEHSSDQVANKEDSIVTVSSTNSSIGSIPDRTEDLKLLYGNFKKIDLNLECILNLIFVY